MRWAVVACVLAGCGGGAPWNGLCARLGPAGCTDDGRATFTCDDAHGYVETACADDERCVAAMCRARACTPSLFYCDHEVARVCDASGTIETVTDCGTMHARCVVGATTASCVPSECAPLTTFCSADGTTLEKCAPDGLSSSTVQTCSDPMQRGNACVGNGCHDRCAILEASDRSTLGCRFAGATLFAGTPTLLIGNPQPDLPATITVENMTFTVAPGASGRLALDGTPGSGLLAASSKSARAIVVRSTVPVYAWLREDGHEGLMLHPEHALSARYLAGLDDNGPHALAVIATANGTSVTVTPSSDTDAGGGVPAGAAGQPLVQTLDRGQVLTLAGANLSGTRVQASAPVAVELGSAVGEASMPGADTLGEQFISPGLGGDVYVVARDDATLTVSFSATVNLAAGHSTIVGGGDTFTSTAPVLAISLAGGREVLPPVEQYRAAGFLPAAAADETTLFAAQPTTVFGASFMVTLASPQGPGGFYWGVTPHGAAGPITAAAPFTGYLQEGDLLPTGYGLASIHP